MGPWAGHGKGRCGAGLLKERRWVDVDNSPSRRSEFRLTNDVKLKRLELEGSTHHQIQAEEEQPARIVCVCSRFGC